MDIRSVLCKILLMVISRSFFTTWCIDSSAAFSSSICFYRSSSSSGPYRASYVRGLRKTRAQLKSCLTEYVKDTLGYIETVRDFCDQEQNWTSERRTELQKMRYINKNQDLGAVLKDTLEGLKKLEPFLEAVEKLTMTSCHVFSKRIFLLRGESPERVQSVISDARIDARFLILFNRDAETFFQPLLDNVNILIFQLNIYVLNTEQLCSRMRQSLVLSGNINEGKTGQPLVQLVLDASENDMKQMLDHLNQLHKIRMNPDTRLALLFQENAQKYIDVFGERRSRMKKNLADLEEAAVMLNRMKTGASISTVVGSSVGIVGGVLSFLGIFFSLFTAGTSLSLTVAGAGLGGISAVNSIVTDSTKMAVNSKHESNAQSYINSYNDDMVKIEDCLKEAVNSERPLVKPSSVDGLTVVHGIGEVLKGTADVVYAVKAFPEFKNEKAIKAALVELKTARGVPQVTVYLSRTEQLAKAKMLKVTKGVSSFLNIFFIGVDGYTIYEESKSLASESEVSKLIRSRAALWKSELDAWEKMYDSLCKGINTICESKKTLEKKFLP